jgi:hypothetical protein
MSTMLSFRLRPCNTIKSRKVTQIELTAMWVVPTGQTTHSQDSTSNGTRDFKLRTNPQHSRLTSRAVYLPRCRRWPPSCSSPGRTAAALDEHHTDRSEIITRYELMTTNTKKFSDRCDASTVYFRAADTDPSHNEQAEDGNISKHVIHAHDFIMYLPALV